MRRIESRGASPQLWCACAVASRTSRSAVAQAQSESWDALFIGNSKVGSIQTRVNPVKDKDRALINVLVDYNLTAPARQRLGRDRDAVRHDRDP